MKLAIYAADKHIKAHHHRYARDRCEDRKDNEYQCNNVTNMCKFSFEEVIINFTE